MERNVFNYAVILTIILLIASCKSNNNVVDVIDGIGNDIQVRLWEKLGENDSRAFELQFNSIDEYNCKNVNIPYQLEQTWYNIDVNLQGVNLPEDCIPGNAPAFVNIPLNNLSFTDYRFGIRLRDVIDNEGVLSVSADKYVLDIKDTKGVIFLNKTLKRVPPKTLWGYIAYENPDKSHVAAEFKTTLESLTSQLIPAEGDYGYYSIDQLGRVTFSNTANIPVQQTFIYKNDLSSSEQINQLISDYRTSNPDMVFKIFTSTGEEY